MCVCVYIWRQPSWHPGITQTYEREIIRITGCLDELLHLSGLQLDFLLGAWQYEFVLVYWKNMSLWEKFPRKCAFCEENVFVCSADECFFS